MAERILPDPSVEAVARPVDAYVQPHLEYPDDGGVRQLMESLSVVNSNLSSAFGKLYEQKAEQEFAQGQLAEANLDPNGSLYGNADGWKKLIEAQRKRDEENGTSYADELLGASPHFRRGLVQAKTKRTALGLSTYLEKQWKANAGGVMGLDDPAAVQQWIADQTAAYAKATGVDSIDPVIASQIFKPQADAAARSLLNSHMSYRSKARVQDFSGEFQNNIGLLIQGAGTGESTQEEWIESMADGEGPGTIQISDADAAAFADELGIGLAPGQVKSTPALAEEASRWKVAKIDKAIEEGGYLEQGYSRDGLRAVAHLGGVDALETFTASAGNTTMVGSEGDDDLSAAYKKFSSLSTQIQAMADSAVARGMKPSKVNEYVVDAVIAQAKMTRNPEVLSILDQLSAGSGPLGNIGWVKEERLKTLDWIEDQNWEDETRAATREEREREERSRLFKTEGFETVLRDPYGDYSQLLLDMTSAGYPGIAKEIREFQKQLQAEDREVFTNHAAVVELRARIYEGEDEQTILTAIKEGTGVLFPSNVAMSLMDDLKQAKGEQADLIRDPGVQRHLTRIREIVADRFAPTELEKMGGVRDTSAEIAYMAEQELVDEVLVYLTKNPEATAAEVRLFARDKSREIMKMEEYKGITFDVPEGGTQTSLDSDKPEQREYDGRDFARAAEDQANPLFGISPEMIADRAMKANMSVAEYTKLVWEAQGYTPPPQTWGQYLNFFDGK